MEMNKSFSKHIVSKIFLNGKLSTYKPLVHYQEKKAINLDLECKILIYSGLHKNQ